MDKMTRLRRGAATLAGLRLLRDNRRLGPLRRRRGRLSLVLLLVLGWATASAGIITEWGGALLIGVGALASGTAFTLLFLATRNLSASLDEYADERERQLRDRAHRFAYWIVILPAAVALGALLGTAVKGGAAVLLGGLKDEVIIAAAGGLILLLAGLPSIVIAFMEPDLPDA